MKADDSIYCYMHQIAQISPNPPPPPTGGTILPTAPTWVLRA